MKTQKLPFASLFLQQFKKKPTENITYIERSEERYRTVRKFKSSKFDKAFIKESILNPVHNMAIRKIKMESSERNASCKSNSVCIFA